MRESDCDATGDGEAEDVGLRLLLRVRHDVQVAGCRDLRARCDAVAHARRIGGVGCRMRDRAHACRRPAPRLAAGRVVGLRSAAIGVAARQGLVVVGRERHVPRADRTARLGEGADRGRHAGCDEQAAGAERQRTAEAEALRVDERVRRRREAHVVAGGRDLRRVAQVAAHVGRVLRTRLDEADGGAEAQRHGLRFRVHARVQQRADGDVPARAARGRRAARRVARRWPDP